MTHLEDRSLHRQATLAAQRMTHAPEWQRDLVTAMAARSGSDSEPEVSPLVVAAVREALADDEPASR